MFIDKQIFDDPLRNPKILLAGLVITFIFASAGFIFLYKATQNMMLLYLPESILLIICLIMVVRNNKNVIPKHRTPRLTITENGFTNTETDEFIPLEEISVILVPLQHHSILVFKDSSEAKGVIEQFQLIEQRSLGLQVEEYCKGKNIQAKVSCFSKNLTSECIDEIGIFGMYIYDLKGLLLELNALHFDKKVYSCPDMGTEIEYLIRYTRF